MFKTKEYEQGSLLQMDQYVIGLLDCVLHVQVYSPADSTINWPNCSGTPFKKNLKLQDLS